MLYVWDYVIKQMLQYNGHFHNNYYYEFDASSEYANSYLGFMSLFQIKLPDMAVMQSCRVAGVCFLCSKLINSMM